ncbi:hypothetical protein BDC45DRAFT_531261 [Circinella umbellata]|nr:hypothetical protein BDC45DRAFT_531261 [Circinella umbellata]
MSTYSSSLSNYSSANEDIEELSDFHERTEITFCTRPLHCYSWRVSFNEINFCVDALNDKGEKTSIYYATLLENQGMFCCITKLSFRKDKPVRSQSGFCHRKLLIPNSILLTSQLRHFAKNDDIFTTPSVFAGVRSGKQLEIEIYVNLYLMIIRMSKQTNILRVNVQVILAY